MVNVDAWKIILRCPKCGIKNEAALNQIEKGETIQCIVCATKINLKDKGGSVESGIRKVQEVVNSLEKAIKEIGGVLKTNNSEM